MMIDHNNPQHPFGKVTRNDVLHALTQGSLFEVYKMFPEAAEVPTAEFDGFSALHSTLAQLAHNLISEECVNEPVTGLLPALNRYIGNPTRENALAIVDGGVDTVYVIFQLFYMLELPFEAAFAEIHANNLAKIQYGEDGKLSKRADGKLMKPENHPKPDLFGVLEEHGNMLAYERKTFGADNWKEGEVKP